MDVINEWNVKVPNALLVGGLTKGVEDNEVMDYLATLGSIDRIIRVTSDEPQFKNTAIVEFTSGEPITFLHDTLPCERHTSNPEVIHSIQLLSELYAADKSSSLTSSYLAELKGVAKLSGADFEKLLRDELAKIQRSTKSNPTNDVDTATLSQSSQVSNNPTHDEPSGDKTVNPTQIDTVLTHTHDSDPNISVPSSPAVALTQKLPNTADVSAAPQAQKAPNPAGAPRAQALPDMADAIARRKAQAFPLAPEHLTTDAVQKVVVEHVIKNSDFAPDRIKLRPFSGKVPCPASESDYDTWRSNVDFFLTDATVSEKHTVRKIVESLLPPAAHIVKNLGPKASPHDYLSLLDSAYDTVDDGDELFARFLNTNQNSGEKPSAYLQRLRTILSKVVKRGGIGATEFDRQLLRQFCRGCWNNALITSLQLEQKKKDPPPFSELLLLLRTEEDRHAAKSSRMKQHLGLPKAKAHANAHFAEEYSLDYAEPEPPSDTQKLEKQIAMLQTQMASLKATLNNGSRPKTAKQTKKQKPKPNMPSEEHSSTESKLTKKPRPGYCFRCGEDGHIAPSCSNDPNPQLVHEKRTNFEQRLQSWDEASEQSLN